ncbi:F-box only protein 3-like [Dreissena polymorpha]|nr:F-box only protein 3-like [Dreissena polymorpha]XP_052243168.1 F-box only protein 3-like [Dreissena polymorpha]XP_052243169.1 F-box only protein 3-like [Dreissena polymorpha]XP_052243170.1 F-box only protein 3-like [Dreissena polymorpha]XP_052243171.1 F-box only protein 3-like [Dreissena polymorpha]XP_052243172.1 F-box only protein 3-like [Dreissena polymorpha]XP_052243173.1 F-box only protein 3-like [Dreissena polymorpha]XP_052243174.1 F-box only protein 3-like [Dreissena polymorpha]XP_
MTQPGVAQHPDEFLMEQPRVLQLPDESLISIMRYLHYKDIISVSHLCHRFHELCMDDSLWKWQCQHYFMEDSCPDGLSWREHFVNWFRDFGKYKNYVAIKTAWNQIEAFLKENCSRLHHCLNVGLSEEDIDKEEERFTFQLPEDFRLSYRIHNGQDHTRLGRGLLGSVTIHTLLETEFLLPLQHCGEFIKGSLRFSVNTTGERSGQAIACTNYQQLKRGTVFYVQDGLYSYEEQRQMSIPYYEMDVSFKDWLCSYAEELTQKQYFLQDEHIFRFCHEPSSVVTSHGITVKPTSMFVPALSRPNTNFFIYRIIMEMAPDVPSSLSCRLVTRHWVITNGDGSTETVNGEGVVGEFPVMKPGSKYFWISCTTFNTLHGTMHGHFMFRNLTTGEAMRVECPPFHMTAMQLKELTVTASDMDTLLQQGDHSPAYHLHSADMGEGDSVSDEDS